MLITLALPERHNVFSPLMMRELICAFDMSDTDDNIRAVVVTGEGGRAFCAGLDLRGDSNPFDFRTAEPDCLIDGVARDIGGRLTLRIFDSLKPVIAAVNGVSIGVGATMQLAMDARIAAVSASYSFLFARRGIVPEAASSWFLPRLVGVQTALDWCLSGRKVDATEACHAGLVVRVVDDNRLLDTALEYAASLTSGTAPVSAALTRQMIWRMLGASHPRAAHEVDSRAIAVRARSSDGKEGVESFLQRRQPRFSDRISADLPDIFGEK